MPTPNFFKDIKILKQQGELANTSISKRVQPFLEEDCLLRFSGRLKDLVGSYETKHRLIISRPKVFPARLVMDCHVQNECI